MARCRDSEGLVGLHEYAYLADTDNARSCRVSRVGFSAMYPQPNHLLRSAGYRHNPSLCRVVRCAISAACQARGYRGT